MNNEIIVISTTAAVTKKVHEVLIARALPFPVFEATMEAALQISQREIANGTKVIICRGGTATYLRERVDVPVVDIRHGFIDIYFSVKEAKLISDKIGVVGYSNLCEAAADYIKIMNMDMPISIVNCDEEIEAKLLELKEQGIEVFIGGFQLLGIAEKHGVAHIMGEADPAAINQSIDEALHDLKIEHERKEKFETINAILNCTSEGIIAIDQFGKVLHINEIAKKIFAYQNERHINEIIPSSHLLDTAINGSEHLGEFLKSGSEAIVVSSVPIKMENRTIGAVATIQEEVKIQTIDHEIRKKDLGIGHFAKKTFKDIVGTSVEINQVMRQASRYAKADSTVLIHGETGTGKEIFAQSIHNYSKRSEQPFVAINCAALPENILESELFGYVKGAFTGASKEGKAGIFELAHNGTVFLDEIGEISTNVQVKLLRVIQEKEVSRIGDDKIIPINVRILAATNKNLIEEIHKGNFREDLYFRLCVLELELPPLRARRSDIKELANYFIEEKSLKKIRFTKEALDVFESYDWPGNIRQLSNVIERLIVISEDGMISEALVRDALKGANMLRPDRKPSNQKTSDLEVKLIRIIENMLSVDTQLKVGEKPSASQMDEAASENDRGDDDGVEVAEANKKPDIMHLRNGLDIDRYLEQREAEIIVAALERYDGNREKTAEFLGISKATLWRKMKKLDLLSS
ncbi:sigma 54-interacting transcriptional regulator [Fusibacter paucivorans]|uniref:Sigma 54-interacting transcriptional regulator n=1 Tax=Fusibacter paucivorans TaxID=76009 RepID=A0ABS5PLW4_9FIRM|nr:sigma 54-interacting transcriptional regulator [Fusibacter paucivorans]MBS7525394.1 sigma 54-interacting transcriptional regulator [Fusibacter paucivorans]